MLNQPAERRLNVRFGVTGQASLGKRLNEAGGIRRSRIAPAT